MKLYYVFLLDEHTSNTKAFMIKQLALCGELSIAQLQNLIKKHLQKTISYQAIRQSILELIDDKIVLKKNSKYSINPAWVLQLKDLVGTLEKLIEKRTIQKLDKDTTQITLKNLSELGYFVLYGLEHNYFNFEKESELYMLLNHLWIPFAEEERRNQLINIFKSNPPKVLVRGNTLGDHILKKWYARFGKIKMDYKDNSDVEYIIHGDCVVQIYMDKILKERMTATYKLSGLVRSDLFQELISMTNQDYPINIIVTRNKAVAEELKNNLEKGFK